MSDDKPLFNPPTPPELRKLHGLECQRDGCDRPLTSPKARYCSGACKQKDYRNARRNRNANRNASPVTPGGKVLAAAKKIIEKPCPPNCPDGKPESHIHVSMPGFATAKPKTKPRGWLMSSGSSKPLDRSHSPGCPCWTCNGIPPKKPVKAKKP